MEEPKVIPIAAGVGPPYVPNPVVTTTELAAIVVIVSVVILASVFQPEQTGTYLAFGATITASLMAWSKGQRNTEQTRALRLEVNHRLTELLEARANEAHAKGREEQRTEDKVTISEQKAEIKADRQDLKDEAAADAAPVEVVNLPPVQKVEIVEKKKG